MKKSFLISLMILLVMGLILGGCSTPAPAPAPTTAPTPTLAPTPEKPIELKFSHYFPPVVWWSPGIYEAWVNEIAQRTNGRVKITIYPAETLGKCGDHYNMVLSDVADISQLDIGATPGIFPLTEMMSLPLNFTSAEANAETWWELSQKYLINTEYSKVHLLWVGSFSITQFQTAKKPIHTLEDLQGMKMGTTQVAGKDFLQRLGAIPVYFAIIDMYTGLERGIIDGICEPWSAAVYHQFLEVTKYRTEVNMHSPVGPVLMNLGVWNSLPPDIQKIFDETTGLELSRKFAVGFADIETAMLKDVIGPYDKENGNPEIYVLPAAERDRLRQTLSPMYEDWITEREAKGVPARAFFNDLQQLAAKYNK